MASRWRRRDAIDTRRCGSVTGPSRAGAGTASDQWDLLASRTCEYVALALPPAIDFDEDKVRSKYEGGHYSQNTQMGRKKLDDKVTYWTDVSGRELAALSTERKIDSIVEARRKAHQAPIDQICQGAASLFETLVQSRIDARRFVDLHNCVGVIGHGHAYGTTGHCGFVDEDVVDESIRDFKAAKAAGLIKYPQDFYSGVHDGGGHVHDTLRGLRLTESLISEDSPLQMMGSEGRISVFNGPDLYATDLSRVTLVPCVVVCGGVKDVDDVETRAGGRLVVALHRRGELYFFLINRGQFLLKNEVTPACAVKILQIAGPLLFLTYRQDAGAVPQLKKEALDDGGLVVGKSANGSMIADFKVAVLKMVARGVSKDLIKFE